MGKVKRGKDYRHYPKYQLNIYRVTKPEDCSTVENAEEILFVLKVLKLIVHHQRFAVPLNSIKKGTLSKGYAISTSKS